MSCHRQPSIRGCPPVYVQLAGARIEMSSVQVGPCSWLVTTSDGQTPILRVRGKSLQNQLQPATYELKTTETTKQEWRFSCVYTCVFCTIVLLGTTSTSLQWGYRTHTQWLSLGLEIAQVDPVPFLGAVLSRAMEVHRFLSNR